VRAYDLGEPTSMAITGTVTITVRRNMFPPEILNLYHEMDVLENRAVSNLDALYTVNARDNDTRVKHCLSPAIKIQSFTFSVKLR